MLMNLVVGLVLMILGYLLMPKPPVNKQEITEMEGPTASAGSPIVVLFGNKLLKAPNYLWWGDKGYVQKWTGQSKKK